MAKCRECNTNDCFESFQYCESCIKLGLKNPKLVINNPLTYVQTYRSKCTGVKMYETLMDRFSDKERNEAKCELIKAYSDVIQIPNDRKAGQQKSKKSYEIDDILKAFSDLESLEDSSVSVCFVSIDIT